MLQLFQENNHYLKTTDCFSSNQGFTDACKMTKLVPDTDENALDVA